MFGVYVHFPYCLRHCPYCDFAVAVSKNVPEERYLRQVLAELMERAALFPGRRLASIYFGGGTPSLWAPARVGEMIRAVLARFPCAQGPGPEITLECDPKTLSARGLAELRHVGVNRLSLGVQSLNERHLKALGRLHTPDEARRAVTLAREAGFDNLSVDLMIGLPGQTEEELRADLSGVLALYPEHVSLYQLTVEPGTALAARVKRGLVVAPDDEVQAEHYLLVREVLERAGFTHYEISSYARAGAPDRRAVHNRLYWTSGEYLGLGASAHSHRRLEDGGGERFANPRAVDDYMALRAFPIDGGMLYERLDREALAREALWLGLRQIEGLSRQGFASLYGYDPAARHEAEIERLRARDLLCLEGDRLRLSRAGVLFADDVGASLL